MFIDGWILHVMLYVPGSSKVTGTSAPPSSSTIGSSTATPSVPSVTVWPDVSVNVTVVPAGIVRVDGVNVVFAIETVSPADPPPSPPLSAGGAELSVELPHAARMRAKIASRAGRVVIRERGMVWSSTVVVVG